MNGDDVDAVVIGGGQAGLAAGNVARRGAEFLEIRYFQFAPQLEKPGRRGLMGERQVTLEFAGGSSLLAITQEARQSIPKWISDDGDLDGQGP
ncbi:MAG: hypothetical protein WCP30_05755 [Mycobacteriaceae bacterium]